MTETLNNDGSGPVADHQHNGERKQDGGNRNRECYRDGHGIPLRSKVAPEHVNEIQTQMLFLPWPPSANSLWKSVRGKVAQLGLQDLVGRGPMVAG